MKEKLKKKILIVGASACEYSLAKKFSEYENISEVFVIPGNAAMKEFATIVDIREANTKEILEFVLENDINLTIVVSETAIKNDIATLFQNNNQMIFAPTYESANICLSKIAGRKFMYRNHIPGVKFGYFDKPALAYEYVNKVDMPIVVKSDFFIEKGVLACNSTKIANSFIEKLFNNNEKVLIEDYIFGHEFSYYVITDGYEALPLGCAATYKNELDGNGGVLTSGMGSFVPDYKISSQLEQRIMQQIIYPTLNTLSKCHTPYVGILGVDIIMDNTEQLFVTKYNSFLKSPDAQSILPTIKENLYDLFQACVIGSFADDYEKIDITDESVISCVLSASKEDAVIEGLDDLDDSTDLAYFNIPKNNYLEYKTIFGRNIVLSKKAKILSKAIDNLYSEVPIIKFDGLKYRKDIGQIIKV